MTDNDPQDELERILEAAVQRTLEELRRVDEEFKQIELDALKSQLKKLGFEENSYQFVTDVVLYLWEKPNTTLQDEGLICH